MKNDFPQLVLAYTRATEKIYGKKVWVPTLEFSKFWVMEDDLREMGASPREYAYTVLKSLKSWAKSHGLDYVPIKVFLGKFAFNKFVKIWNSKTIVIDDDKNDETEVIHSELLVAEAFIEERLHGNNVSFDQTVKNLRPVLSEKWLEMYNTHRYRACSGYVIDNLCMKYNIRYARDYYTLMEEILKRVESNGRTV